MDIFKDRKDAGRQLADKLEAYRGTDAVVLALPRGGVVLGYEIARALLLPFDIVVTRKIGHPFSSELAIGAVDADGMVLLDEQAVASVDSAWLKKETMRQQNEAGRRTVLYRKGRAAVPLTGKSVIIVDDGIATGLTMELAVRKVLQDRPEKIVVALPVASADALSRIGGKVDEIIVLQDPEMFRGAVGSHYAEFDQLSDTEVIDLLHAIPAVSQ